MTVITDTDLKIKQFFEAINTIETQSDGSIVINWKSNVAHNVNGHLITNATDYNISFGKEIHLNPKWTKPLDNYNFAETEQEISKGKKVEQKIMAHQFVIKDKGEFLYFDKFEDIPETFDNVIRFEPEIPPEPHSEEQHNEISLWNDKLQELMKRERK